MNALLLIFHYLLLACEIGWSAEQKASNHTMSAPLTSISVYLGPERLKMPLFRFFYCIYVLRIPFIEYETVWKVNIDSTVHVLKLLDRRTDTHTHTRRINAFLL